MRTKISLVLGRRQPLSPETALGCLSTNLAVPGSGSLLAGRISGYPQLAMALGGMVMTFVCGARFVAWSVSHWSDFQAPDADPILTLTNLWLAARWPLLGIGCFAFGWLWALFTSFDIVREAKRNHLPDQPPILKPAAESSDTH